jgi:hypothetical protein
MQKKSPNKKRNTGAEFERKQGWKHTHVLQCFHCNQEVISIIVTIYTSFFSNISHTECIYGFHNIPRKAVINWRHRINRLVLVMELQFVFCDIGAGFINTVGPRYTILIRSRSLDLYQTKRIRNEFFP